MSFRARMKITSDYYKRNGIIKTIKKVKYKTLRAVKDSKKKKKCAEDYKLWIANNEPKTDELEKQSNTRFEFEPKISVVVPMYNTKEHFLRDVVDSMLNQTYKNWELCLADGSPKKLDYVDKYINQSDKIKYKFLNDNKGISGNTNCAIEMASGEYVALLDHDDLLPPFSLYEIVKTINENRDVEFIYTDEDKIYDGKRIDPHFKPDYAPDTLMSYNYICHFAIYKKSLLEKTGLLNAEFDGSQDYDFILRATENANKIVHIPKILYNWRMNEDSVALNSSAKPYAYEAAKRAINAHLKRIGEEGEALDSEIVGIYKVKYKIKGNPKVSIIIYNAESSSLVKRCLKSVISNTKYNNYDINVLCNNNEKSTFDEFKGENVKVLAYGDEKFSYTKQKNFGAQNSDGEYIIFIDANVKVISEEWLETLLGNCERNEVGVVGGKVLYNNSTIEHAGIMLDSDKIIGFVSRGVNACESGYMGRNTIIQNYSAVSGELLIISRADYNQVGGFDESFSGIYADVDLCLKLIDAGKVTVLNPLVVGKQKNTHEEAENDDGSRFKLKWAKKYNRYDPYYSPNFRQDVLDMSIRTN